MSGIVKKELTKIHETFLNQFFFYMISELSVKRNVKFGKFFIFAQGRTGSKLLSDLLNSHEAIACDKELFNNSFYLGKGNILFPTKLISGKAKWHRNKAYGFKDKIYQLDKQKNISSAEAFVYFLYRNNWKIIYLKRENIFKHVLSGLIAKKRKQFHSYKNKENKEFGQVYINPSELFDRMERRRSFQKREEKILKGIPHVEFSYEEDLLDAEKQQKTASKIFSLLNLEDQKVSTRFKKVNTKDNEQLIANYKEIREALKNTPYFKWV